MNLSFRLSVLVSLPLSFYLSVRHGVAVSGVITLCLATCLYLSLTFVIRQVRRAWKVWSYTNRVEPIIVSSNHLGDTSVDRRYQEELEYVRLSKNQQGLRVVRLIRGEYPYCNETDEEWEARVLKAQQKAVLATHKELRSKSTEDYYVHFVLKQEGRGWQRVRYRQ